MCKCVFVYGHLLLGLRSLRSSSKGVQLTTGSLYDAQAQPDNSREVDGEWNGSEKPLQEENERNRKFLDRQTPGIKIKKDK